MEVKRLEELGFSIKGQDEFPKTQTLIVQKEFTGTHYEFEINFPDTYPYFRPSVSSKHLNLPHHVNPLSGDICLLGRDTELWDPLDLVGDLIENKFPEVLSAESVVISGGKPNEDQQAEPWSEYINPHTQFRLFWSSDVRLPEGVVHGHASLRIEKKGDLLTAVVEKVYSGTDIYWEGKCPQLASSNNTYKAPFVVIGRHPHEANLREEFEAHFPSFISKDNVHEFLRGALSGVLGLVFFPEEVGHREVGLGLVGLLAHGSKKGTTGSADYIKAFRSGKSDYFVRTAKFSSLNSKSILLVGAGSIGSKVATALARSGVGKLALIDGDVVEPGNACRWELGYQYATMPKVEALTKFIRANFPFTEVMPLQYKLGAGDPSAFEAFEKLFEGVEAVVDCSASRGVQDYLSSKAAVIRMPYFFAEGYPGLLGGSFGCVSLPETPCFRCFLQYIVDLNQEGKTIAPEPRESFLQPRGCSEPTFIGSDVDASLIANMLTRQVVIRLSEVEGYPKQSPGYYSIVLADDAESEVYLELKKLEVIRRKECCWCAE